MKRKRDRLCIIGSAPSKSEAPYNDDRYDIWAVSGAAYSESLDGMANPDTEDNTWNSVHRVDVFFEMHKRATFKDRIERLSTCGKPVIMQRKERDIPTSEAYPVEEIADALGEDYSSSISYMLAYAIFLGYKEIRLYGIILLHKSEYIRERPGAKYYIGVAHAKGINVWAPDNTQLTTSLWRYGYDDHDTLCGQIMAKKATIEDDIKNQTKLIEQQVEILHRLKGAQITCDNLAAEIKGGLS